jgi:hypothetical protein
MTIYEGTAVKDKAVIRKSSATGMKIGALKTGAPIVGDKLEDGSDGKKWMHISKPMDGWVLTEDINYTDSEADSSSTPSNVPAPDSATLDSTINQSTTNSNGIGKFRLKRWDELNPSDSFSARERGGVDQFSFYTPYITDASGKWCGDWSSNNNFSILTSADMQKIAAMQIEDESNLKAKMAWLTWAGEDSWGAPMRCNGNWNEVNQVKMIAAFYAGQMVEVLERRTIFCNFQGVKDNVPMSRIRTFSRADFGKTFATDPHLIHKVTAVSTSNNYREKVKGTVYIPVALGPEFDFAGQFQPANWWLMDRWIAYPSS